MISNKQLFILFSLGFLIYACGTSPIKKESTAKEEPVVIANDSLEYEIIIIDPGFNYYLNAIAQPKGFYSQNYLERRNIIWVTNWNIRAQEPTRFGTTIYENVIDYQTGIDYGYEVNYKLFNYFLFAQRKYNIDLGGGFRKDRIN